MEAPGSHEPRPYPFGRASQWHPESQSLCLAQAWSSLSRIGEAGKVSPAIAREMPPGQTAAGHSQGSSFRPAENNGPVCHPGRAPGAQSAFHCQHSLSRPLGPRGWVTLMGLTKAVTQSSQLGPVAWCRGIGSALLILAPPQTGPSWSQAQRVRALWRPGLCHWVQRPLPGRASSRRPEDSQYRARRPGTHSPVNWGCSMVPGGQSQERPWATGTMAHGNITHRIIRLQEQMLSSSQMGTPAASPSPSWMWSLPTRAVQVPGPCCGCQWGAALCRL